MFQGYIIWWIVMFFHKKGIGKNIIYIQVKFIYCFMNMYKYVFPFFLIGLIQTNARGVIWMEIFTLFVGTRIEFRLSKLNRWTITPHQLCNLIMMLLLRYIYFYILTPIV